MTATGQISADIRCARDYERLAAAHLPPETLAHLMGGSGEDAAAAANLAAFQRVTITPRLLRPVAGGSTRLELSGQGRPHPIFLAPVAHQTLFHANGEVEAARAAAAAETCFVASTLSSRTLEDIAAAGGPDRWFQLYFQPARDATLDLVRRVEAAGYTALVVTLDAPVQAPSLSAQRAGFRSGRLIAANLSSHPAPPPLALAHGQSRILDGMMREAPTLADLDWLKSQTRLPISIKGVMHREDARDLIAWGAAGLIVSNHGGRALDAAPASLAVLAQVRAAVGPNAALLFDGGVRSGADIFKALALGADAVMVGRLQACALAVGGALGVAHMIRLLREELELTMALAGCASLADIRAATVEPC